MTDSSDFEIDSHILRQLNRISLNDLSTPPNNEKPIQEPASKGSPLREITFSEFTDLLVTLKIPFIGTSEHVLHDNFSTGTLGQGGFGQVHYDMDAIVDDQTRADVAIKEFKVSYTTYNTYSNETILNSTITQAYTEICVMKDERLSNHANILHLLGFTELNNPYFVGQQLSSSQISLVVEFADNDDLDTYLRRLGAGLDWGVKNGLICGIASGLQALHAADIIHNDIKASNVLVFTEPAPGKGVVAKLSDFGCSILLAKTKPRKAAAGTLVFAPPEAYSPECLADTSRDVYSFALVILHILGGRAPFLDFKSFEAFEHKQDSPRLWEYIYNFLNSGPGGAQYSTGSEALVMMRDLLAVDLNKRTVDLQKIREYFEQFIYWFKPNRTSRIDDEERTYNFDPKWLLQNLESASLATTVCGLRSKV